MGMNCFDSSYPFFFGFNVLFILAASLLKMRKRLSQFSIFLTGIPVNSPINDLVKKVMSLQRSEIFP